MAVASAPCERLLVVGVGDDGPDGLAPKVLKRIEAADVLAGGRRHLDLFPGIGSERLVIADDLDALIGRLESKVGRKQVVVLASGDPCLFGIGPLLAKRLGHEHIEIVPGVSSPALALARLGLSWHDATVVSAHGRPLDIAVARARSATKLAVLTDDVNTPAAVAAALLRAGAADGNAWVFEHLGGAAERAVDGTLSQIAAQAFASLNVLVVPELVWPAANRRFGQPESCFAHSRGLITKAEVRAVSLSKLGLSDGAVLWDVGAGSGSLAIEAARLIPRLRAFAVERSTKQIRLLKRNLDRHTGTLDVTIVEGESPEALQSLPPPDAVFVGGGGERLMEILDACATRLCAGGRIVANLVALERVASMLEWARKRTLAVELVQVSIARGSEIAGATRLDAQNPVYVVTVST